MRCGKILPLKVSQYDNKVKQYEMYASISLISQQVNFSLNRYDFTDFLLYLQREFKILLSLNNVFALIKLRKVNIGQPGRAVKYQKRFMACNKKKISNEIRSYFKLKGWTYSEAAAILGCKPQTVANRICSGIFGTYSATRWSEKLGFNRDFLLTGKDRLINK